MKPFDQDRRAGCRRSRCRGSGYRRSQYRRSQHRQSQCGRSRRRLRVGLLRIALLTLALCGAIAPSLAQTPTSKDGLGSRVQGSLFTNHAVLADGGILVGGEFLLVDGETTGLIVRLGPDGVLDESFDPAPDGIVDVMLEQPDGKILVGGRFTTIAGQPRSQLARLNPDGSLDTGFQADATPGGISPGVYDLALQPDGKILVVGNFGALAGEAADSVARLLPDGTFDHDFDPPDGSSNVEAVEIDRFGRVLLGGWFTSPARSLVRLNRDGSIDTSFDPGVLGSVYALAIQADFSILVGGSSVNPQSGGQLARFGDDGAQDLGFDPDIDDTVEAIEVQADGRILIGGGFVEVEGEGRLLSARLLLDGSLDPSFVADHRPGIQRVRPNTITELADGRILIAGSGGLRRLHADGTVDQTLERGADWFIFALAIQADGRIVVGGAFDQLAGTARVGIGRFFPDGFLDTGFVASIESTTFLDERVLALVAQEDGKIVVGGEFDTLSGSGRDNLGRVHADGTLDTGFVPLGANNGVVALALEPDGDLLVGGDFDQLGGLARSKLGRITSDGAIDTAFAPNANGRVSALAVQPDGRILVGGNFTAIGGELRQNLARLHPDGSVDEDFDPLPDGRVQAIVVQPDGRILVGGYFQSIAGGSRDFVARLDSDGTLDETFDAGTIAPSSSRINALALQHDGRILLGGSSQTMGDEIRWGIGRLHPDGSLDEDFDVGFLAGLVNPGQIMALALQHDDKILAAGFFTAVGGVERDSLVRLRDAPPPTPHLEVRSDGVTWFRDGGPALDRVELEWSTNGSTWSPVGAMSRVGTTGDWELDVVAPPGVLRSFRARGVHGPGSGSILETGRVSWIRPDTDGDGLPDDHELFYGLDPNDPDDAALDPDGDGLSSLEELLIHPWLDPQNPDTDGDGIDDRLDRNPLVADNACAAAGSADVSFTEVVTGIVTCGATTSIVAMHPAAIETHGDLLLIAPRVVFQAGFQVRGRLRVKAVHPCAACP
jgi:uncharacterized delta-60 repeat protein